MDNEIAYQTQATAPHHRVPLLNVEIGPQFLLEFKDKEKRINSFLVGAVHKNFIIVHLPALNEFRSRMSEGNYVVIRYVTLGNVRGFRSRILSTTLEPIPLVFLSYPHTIETVNLRKAKRVACYIPTAATVGQTAQKGMLTDINLSGCRFNFHTEKEPEELFQSGDILGLSSPLLEIEKDQNCTGCIQNITRNSNSVTLGIQFEKINAEIVSKIEIYMQSVSEYEGG